MRDWGALSNKEKVFYIDQLAEKYHLTSIEWLLLIKSMIVSATNGLAQRRIIEMNEKDSRLLVEKSSLITKRKARLDTLRSDLSKRLQEDKSIYDSGLYQRAWWLGRELGISFFSIREFRQPPHVNLENLLKMMEVLKQMVKKVSRFRRLA